MRVLCFLPFIFCFLFAPGWAQNGVALFEAGKFQEAQKAFQDRLDKQIDDPEALYYLGRLTTEGASSRRFFERLLEKHPDHALADDALFELAEADYADPGERFLSARRRYHRLLERYPQSNYVPAAFYRIGLTYLAVNVPDSALLAFNQSIEHSASEWGPLARLGAIEALSLLGRRDQALQLAEVWMQKGAGDLKAELQALIDHLRPKGDGLTRPDSSSVHPSVFWVRVGAFGNVRNVEALKNRLQQAGFVVSIAAREGSPLQFVFTGPYHGRELAELDRKKISQLEKLPCVVTDKQ